MFDKVKLKALKNILEKAYPGREYSVEKIWKFDIDFSKNQNYINGVNYSILSIMITADWIASGNLWREMINKIPDKKANAHHFDSGACEKAYKSAKGCL